MMSATSDKKTVSTAASKERYSEAVGRRKTSIARARLTASTKTAVVINGKDLVSYFPTKDLQDIVLEPFTKAKVPGTFDISIKVSGGGIHSQSEAIRHAISRVLIKINPTLRKQVKAEGFLKRDPRAKERRKFGLKKARKAPQWAKR